MAARTQSDRIAALEEGYRNIGRELGGIREDFQAFSRDVRNELGHRSRTQWSPILASVSLVVAILGGLITLGAQGPIRDLERHEAAIVGLRHEAGSVSASRFTLEDGRRVWEAIAELRDEDFDRPEANAMLADLIGRIDLRDEGIRREFLAAAKALSDRLTLIEARVLPREP